MEYTANAKVEVIEVDWKGRDYENVGLMYTIACTECGEQGSFKHYNDARAKAQAHRGEHMEMGQG